MEWTILLGQFGGFWVIVGVVFNLFYVPKAFMVPRWKKDSADIEEEKFHVSGPNLPTPKPHIHLVQSAKARGTRTDVCFRLILPPDPSLGIFGMPPHRCTSRRYGRASRTPRRARAPSLWNRRCRRLGLLPPPQRPSRSFRRRRQHRLWTTRRGSKPRTLRGPRRDPSSSDAHSALGGRLWLS